MSKSLTILFLSSSSGSHGGGELYLIFLGRALAKRGHRVVLWASNNERMDELCDSFAEFGEVVRHDYANTYDYKVRSLHYVSRMFSSEKALAESWKSVGPDVIHVNKQCLEDGLDLLAAAETSAVPHLTFLHITQSAVYLKAKHAPARDWISKKYLNRYRGPLVTHSNRLKQLQEFLGRSENTMSIDNGVSNPSDEAYQQTRAQGRSELGLNDDHFLIVGVGRIEEQKRPDRFREMAYRLQQKVPGSRVIWIGAGRLEGEWDAWIAERGITQHFDRLGWKKDVFPYLAAADIYLHPAGYEGMPFSLLEAMAWNNPCVMMDELASELAYFDDTMAIIAEDGQDAWIEKALDAEHRLRVQTHARQLVESHFSIDKMAKEYEDLYLQLAKHE